MVLKHAVTFVIYIFLSHFQFEYASTFQRKMPMSLDDFIDLHPMVTLTQPEYGQDFGLGRRIHIGTSPTQCVQSFVNADGLPYRFLLVGRLMSFKVVEDSVCVNRFYICLRKCITETVLH